MSTMWGDKNQKQLTFGNDVKQECAKQVAYTSGVIKCIYVTMTAWVNNLFIFDQPTGQRVSMMFQFPS